METASLGFGEELKSIPTALPDIKPLSLENFWLQKRKESNTK